MSKSRIEKLANYSVVVIALSALIVSIWQVKLFQNHNKLTVKPYLDSHVILEDSVMLVSFSNKGLGPAIVEKMSYEINGKEYATIYDLLHSSGEQENILRTYNYPKNSVLSSGEKKLILELKNPKYRGIKVKVEYQSIYHESEEMEFEF